MFFNIVKDLLKSIERLSKHVVRFRTQYTIFIQFNKVFFNIVKDLLKSIERLSKHVVRFRTQYTIFIQFNKVFFNIVKDLLKSIERLSRSGKVQIGSKAEGIIVLSDLR